MPTSSRVFGSNVSSDDTFYMPWEDFCEIFTNIYYGVDFPSEWTGVTLKGEWKKNTGGGNVSKRTWLANPHFRFRVHNDGTRLFAQLCVEESVVLQKDPFAFTVCELDSEGKPTHPRNEALIPGSNPPKPQASYTFSSSTSIDVSLERGDYALVPSTWKRKCEGRFYINVWFEQPMTVEGAIIKGKEQFHFPENGKAGIPYEGIQLLPIVP